MAGSVQHTSSRNLTNSPRFELYNDDDDDDDDEDGNDGDDDDDVGDGVKKGHIPGVPCYSRWFLCAFFLLRL